MRYDRPSYQEVIEGRYLNHNCGRKYLPHYFPGNNASRPFQQTSIGEFERECLWP